MRNMVTRRQLLAGFGIIAVSGTVVAADRGMISCSSEDDKWVAKNVVLRNQSDTGASINLKMKKKVSDKSDCQSDSSNDDTCYENVLVWNTALAPNEVHVIEEVYTSPGVYHVTAETDAGRSDSNSRIQLWRENDNVVGMGTEVTIRENRRVAVVGFTNSGVGNPPPLG